MSPAKIENPTIVFVKNGTVVLEFDEFRKKIDLLPNENRFKLDLYLSEKDIIKGLDYVLFRGQVITRIDQLGLEVKNNQKAVEISNEGEIRTILGTKDGFDIMSARAGEFDKYFAGQILMTRSGVTLSAKLGKSR